MDEKLKENLAKRLLYLTKVIFGFLIICLIVFFDYLDYKELKSKSEYIGLLIKLNNIRSEQFDAAHTEHKIASWVDLNNKEVSHNYIASRKAIAGLLINVGVEKKVIRASKGYKEGEKNEFKALYISVEKKLTDSEIESTFNNISVEEMMKKFNYYAQPIQLSILINADTTLLRKRIFDKVFEKLENGDYDEPIKPKDDSSAKLKFFQSIYEFKDVSPKKDSVVLTFYENIGAAQREPNDVHITTKGTFTTISSPPILFFADFDSTLVSELYQNKLLQKNIVSEYGKISINDIDKLLSEFISKNIKAVSILGIDISRRWFPLTLLLLLVVINYLLLKNIMKANNLNLTVISEYEEDDALDFMIKNKFIRGLLWISTPITIVSLILLTSFIQYSNFYYGILIVSVFLSFYLGLKAFISSRKL